MCLLLTKIKINASVVVCLLEMNCKTNSQWFVKSICLY